MPFLNRIGSGAINKFGFRLTFAPGIPTLVTASLPSTYGNTTASVSWTAPLTLGSPLFNDYSIQYSSNGGSTWTTFTHAASIATSITVTGLTNGTEYIFRVAAANIIGIGVYSSSSNAVTPLYGKLPTPIVSDIAETTSTVPLCYDNYDASYTYNYYNYNFAPNDISGSCQGWTGLGYDQFRETYVYVSKAGWANSDSIYLSETSQPEPPPSFPVDPGFPVTPGFPVDPGFPVCPDCGGVACCGSCFPDPKSPSNPPVCI